VKNLFDPTLVEDTKQRIMYKHVDYHLRQFSV
jgi:hypothetical protein